MTWKEFVYDLVVQHCERSGERAFTLQELQKQNKDEISGFRDKAKTPNATVRRVLQELRDVDLIAFKSKGEYCLRGQDLPILQAGAEDESLIEIIKKSPVEKREYFFEVFVRDASWKTKATKVFGFDCLLPKCVNSFIKEDGTPYIEVHHIKSLCEGGENNIGNLSVVCAHHHRMAHYADVRTREDIQNILIEKNGSIISD